MSRLVRQSQVPLHYVHYLTEFRCCLVRNQVARHEGTRPPVGARLVVQTLWQASKQRRAWMHGHTHVPVLTGTLLHAGRTRPSHTHSGEAPASHNDKSESDYREGAVYAPGSQLSRLLTLCTLTRATADSAVHRDGTQLEVRGCPSRRAPRKKSRVPRR